MREARRAVLALGVAAALWGCAAPGPPRDLDELVVLDSVYHEPGSMEPFSGPVARAFPDDSTAVEVEGALREGLWHGEMVVYHPSGRVRYQGRFANGERCGPWTENSLDREPVDAYEGLLAEVGALGLYPPCPDDS